MRGREVGTPGISECRGWPFWGLHCSRLSSYPLADAGKAGSTYSAYSNDIQKADFVAERGLGANTKGYTLICHTASMLVSPHNHNRFDSHLKTVSEKHVCSHASYSHVQCFTREHM